MDTSITAEEIDFIVRRAGYTLTPEQKADLLTAYPYVAAMVARVHGTRSKEAEPAHIFVPGEGIAP